MLGFGNPPRPLKKSLTMRDQNGFIKVCLTHHHQATASTHTEAQNRNCLVFRQRILLRVRQYWSLEESRLSNR